MMVRIFLCNGKRRTVIQPPGFSIDRRGQAIEDLVASEIGNHLVKVIFCSMPLFIGRAADNFHRLTWS